VPAFWQRSFTNPGAAQLLLVYAGNRPVAVIDGHAFNALKLSFNVKLSRPRGPKAGTGRLGRWVRLHAVVPF